MRALVDAEPAIRRMGYRGGGRAVRSARGRGTRQRRALGIRRAPACDPAVSRRGRHAAYEAELAARHTGMLAGADRARRLHAHPVPGVRGALRRPDPEHSSLAAAQVSRPAHPPPGARGPTMEHGATVHFVTASSTAAPGSSRHARGAAGGRCGQLAARVHVLEHRIYPLAVRWYCTGRLRYAEGRAWLDNQVLSGPVLYDGSRRIDAARESLMCAGGTRGRWVGAWPACLAAASLAAAPARSTDMPADPADAGPEPFSAHYMAEWRDIRVGTSDLELERDAQPGHYHYKWTISARGIFRLVYSHDVTQQSWFSIVDNHMRPRRIPRRGRLLFVAFEFDWNAAHARDHPRASRWIYALNPEPQDLMSIQVEIMMDLKNGTLPPTFHIVDKDEMKEFLYTREGDAKLSTAIGTLDTVIVASRRAHGQPGAAHVVRALVGLRAGAGGAQPRRQTRVRDADQDAAALTARAGIRACGDAQVFGSVTPRWPWYLPPRSLYEVSQTSSDSKNSICATPSLA